MLHTVLFSRAELKFPRDQGQMLFFTLCLSVVVLNRMPGRYTIPHAKEKSRMPGAPQEFAITFYHLHPKNLQTITHITQALAIILLQFKYTTRLVVIYFE